MTSQLHLRWFRKHSSRITGLTLSGFGDEDGTAGLRESFGLLLLGILSPTLQKLKILGCEQVLSLPVCRCPTNIANCTAVVWVVCVATPPSTFEPGPLAASDENSAAHRFWLATSCQHWLRSQHCAACTCKSQSRCAFIVPLFATDTVQYLMLMCPSVALLKSWQSAPQRCMSYRAVLCRSPHSTSQMPCNT
jgi:hypothetical protein